MKKQVATILSVLLLGYVVAAPATNHNTYPASDWVIQNHCKIPVLFTITNEDGNIELQKVLQAGELYNQNMDRPRTMGQAQRNPTFTAMTLNNNHKNTIDFYMGGYWNGYSGGIKIHVPYFYYNKDLDKSGCM